MDSGTFDRGRHGSLTANAVPGSTLACSGVFSIRNSPKSVNMGTSEPEKYLVGRWGRERGGRGERGWSERGMICNGLVSIPSWEIVIPQLPGYYTPERQTSTNLIS